MSWIKVENDKPVEGSEVMITFKNEVGLHVGEATYENNRYMYVAETDNCTFSEPYLNVIAWMPKPLAYDEGLIILPSKEERLILYISLLLDSDWIGNDRIVLEISKLMNDYKNS